MSRCPITYQSCDGRYSAAGLKLLSRSLTELKDLPFSARELRYEAAAEKLSALLTQDYLENEAAKGKRKDFTKVLNAVPHAKPELHDSL